MYDIAILGGSLVNLISALSYATDGMNVCILEKSKNIGGAWKTSNLCGASNVEVGCHILAPSGKPEMDKLSYLFLAKNLKLELITMDPRPLNCVNPNVSDEVLKTYNYVYPRGGTAGLLAKMIEHPLLSKIDIKTEKFVKDVELLNDHSLIRGEEWEVLARKCVFPNYFGIDQIKIDNTVYEVPFEKRLCHHVILRVETQRNLDMQFSYAQHILNENNIDRVSNVSKFMDTGLPENQTILCLRVSYERKGSFKKDREFAISCLDDLISENICDPDCKLIDFDYVDYTTSYRNKENLALLRSLDHQSFEYLNSTELLISLSENIEKWSNVQL